MFYSIDATREPKPDASGPKLGRLVNHGNTAKERNSRMKVLPGPVLALYATRHIHVGEEILYDYGIPVPWIKQVCIAL